MRHSTRSVLEDYYAELFGIDRQSVWNAVTAQTRSGRLKDYEGYYVATRGAGAHVSAPPSADLRVLKALAKEPVEIIRQPAFWEEFAATRALRDIGPSTHAYLDGDPGPVDGVVRVNGDELTSLRRLVADADRAESGWNDKPAHAFGLYEDGVLVAASNLNSFHQQPRDIGVIVAQGWRGRGLSEKLGRHAASFAIREHGFARWGARHANGASVAASRRLGFEPWCCQLAVR